MLLLVHVPSSCCRTSSKDLCLVSFTINLYLQVFAAGTPDSASPENVSSFTFVTNLQIFTTITPLQLISNDILKCSSKKGGLFSYISCSTMTALKSVRKADEKASFEILPGVCLVKDGQQQLRRGKELTVEELPTDSRLRAVKLAEMLMEASTSFISGRSLKISLPKMGPVAVSRALEEGCFVVLLAALV